MESKAKKKPQNNNNNQATLMLLQTGVNSKVLYVRVHGRWRTRKEQNADTWGTARWNRDTGVLVVGIFSLLFTKESWSPFKLCMSLMMALYKAVSINERRW